MSNRTISQLVETLTVVNGDYIPIMRSGIPYKVNATNLATVSGSFYLNSNPSGFVTRTQTGNFLLATGGRASNLSITDTLVLTGNGVFIFGSDAGIYDRFAVNAFDPNGRVLNDLNGTATLDWGGRTLSSSNGGLSFDWDNRLARDNNLQVAFSWGSGLSGNGSLLTNLPTGNRTIIAQSQRINFKTTGNFNILTVPNNTLFLIDSMEVITSDISSPNFTAPTVRFGNTSDFAAYQNTILTTSNFPYARHIFDNPQNAVPALTTITASIISGALSSTHSGYLLYKGTFITN